MATHQSIHLAHRSSGPILASETFAFQSHTTPTHTDLEDGEVVLQVLYLNIDPAMRGWLDDKRSYHATVQLGEVMHGYSIGVKIDRALGTGLGDWLGVLGITGMTAYFGMTEIARVNPGDLVVVTGAEGATGSLAGQIAKLRGAAVVGIAGSDAKCSWLADELGFDKALNYEAPGFRAEFASATADLIDVFYDNVGGELLDLGLERAKAHARFVLCGAISQHNNGNAYGLRNYLMITRMRITVRGFVIFDYADRFNVARRCLADWLREGRIQHAQTVLRGGLRQAETGLIGLYNGKNTGEIMFSMNQHLILMSAAAIGKLLVEVARPP
ncbi:hypothetical protein BJY04DRAFT_222510 [Aspergillus karnatakaensis]|uniref:uncharacterized protein n=1 Tax=Aspergillus karnatakaensis TaxID=1810916 RepID=UPI003CCD3458